MIPTQLSSSPVKPKRRATPIQAAHNTLEKRSIMVYGVPQSGAKVPLKTIINHNQSERKLKCSPNKLNTLFLFAHLQES